MKYECPSCCLTWNDDKYPEDKICHPLCSFCSLQHTQKELLNWQMNHIENINSEKLPKLLHHFYRFVELELNLLKKKVYETEQRILQNNIGKS